jgi:hypothetical protein
LTVVILAIILKRLSVFSLISLRLSGASPLHILSNTLDPILLLSVLAFLIILYPPLIRLTFLLTLAIGERESLLTGFTALYGQLFFGSHLILPSCFILVYIRSLALREHGMAGGILCDLVLRADLSDL